MTQELNQSHQTEFASPSQYRCCAPFAFDILESRLLLSADPIGATALLIPADFENRAVVAAALDPAMSHRDSDRRDATEPARNLNGAPDNGRWSEDESINQGNGKENHADQVLPGYGDARVTAQNRIKDVIQLVEAEFEHAKLGDRIFVEMVVLDDTRQALS